MSGSLNAVVDPYDDDFSSLKQLFAGRTMPEFIKTASIMATDKLSRLPDHAFAVVMLDGNRCMRKYACVDKAHTAVNLGSLQLQHTPRYTGKNLRSNHVQAL